MKITFGCPLGKPDDSLDGKEWPFALLIEAEDKRLMYGVPEYFRHGFNYEGKAWIPSDTGAAPYLGFRGEEPQNPELPYLPINPHT